MFTEYGKVELYGRPEFNDLTNWIVAKTSAKWYEIGILLKISIPKLEEIKCNTTFAGDCKKMLIEVMRIWKTKPHREKPFNWETILNVLASEIVGDVSLAYEVAEKIKSLQKQPYNDEELQKLCGCGNCSLEDIITKGCSRPDAMPRFPILDVSRLPPCKRQQYECILMNEADLINETFGSLIDDIRSSMNDRKVKTKSVVTFLNGSRLFKTTAVDNFFSQLHAQLNQAQDISDVFIVLSTITSWFNHHPLGLVVKRYGSDDDRDAYKKFITVDVTRYLQRSVTEIPKDAFGPGIEGSGHFKVKIDHPLSHEHITGTQLSRLIKDVSTALDIPMDCITLCAIEEGCLMLDLSIPMTIYKELFSPLSLSQCKEFETIVVEGPNDLPIKIIGIQYEDKFHKIPVSPETIFFATLYKNLPGIKITYANAAKDIQKTFTNVKADLKKLNENKDKVGDVPEINYFYACLNGTKQAAYNYLESVSQIPKKLSEECDPIMEELKLEHSEKLEALRKDINEGLDKSERLYQKLERTSKNLIISCDKAAEVCKTRKNEAIAKAAIGGTVGVAASVGLGIITIGIGGYIFGGMTTAALAVTAAIIAYFGLGAATFSNMGTAFGEMEARSLSQLQRSINDARKIQLTIANEGLETILRKIQTKAKEDYREAAGHLEATKKVLWPKRY